MAQLSFRQIRIGEQLAGLWGLDEVLATFYSQGQVPEVALGPRLLEAIEPDNYVFPNARPLYEEALVREYRRFCQQKQAGTAAAIVRVSPRTWRGQPREQVPWYPTIYTEHCDGCGACLRFCAYGVYELEPEAAQAIVVDPFNCVVGCDACAKVCKRGAIHFPPRESLTRIE